MGTKATDKLAAVTSVPEPKDVNFQIDFDIWTYDKNGRRVDSWNFTDQVTDFRLDLNTVQASTVEIDLEDDDFTVLEDDLFNNWAFNIKDVSLSSSKKFKPTRLTASTNNSYLGDQSDLEWVLGQKPIDLTVGQVYFRLCGLASQQTTVTTTFEDRVASLLRDQSGHKSWNRSQHTRAQFVAMLCREAGVDYWIPEIDVKQPVIIDKTSTGSSTTTLVTGKSVSASAPLTVKGQPATPSQKATAGVIMGVAQQLGANAAAMTAMMFAAIWESGITDHDPPNSLGYGGVLAGHDNIYHGDSVAQATAFMHGGGGYESGGAIALSKTVSNPVEIAVRVEVPSIWPNNAYAAESGYPGDAAATREAQGWVEAFGGGITLGSTRTVTTSGSYAFTRGPNEDSWDAIQRLASEVAWYAFVRQNRLWFVSGNYLFQQTPQMTIQAGKDGIDYIDVDMDMGARDQIAQLNVYGRTSLWTALPGMVVQVTRRGPANGKWIVASVSSHPLDASQQVQVTLQKPVPKRSEPAAPAATKSTSPTILGTPVLKGGATNPAPGATWGRLDMGFDGNYDMGQGAVAPYNGTVHYPIESGWPGQGVYFAIRNDDQSGPDYTRAMYFAEGATPSVANGAHVTAGQKIGNPVQSGGTGAPGNFEIGPADPNSLDVLVKSYGLGSSKARATVTAFASWLQSLGAGSPSSTSNAGAP